MNELAESSPPAIKVVDRRRFTAQGHARPDAELRPAPAPEAPAPAAGASRPSERPSERPAERPAEPALRPAPGQAAAEQEPLRIELLPFVAQLASNALAALGVLPDGQGSGMPRDPSVAREYIDIIVMLERKTRGNLSEQEHATLTQLVADLRLHYVEATRSVQPVR